MPTQTEILEALDRAINDLKAQQYTDDFGVPMNDELEADASTLASLRDQIAKGPVRYLDPHRNMTAVSDHVGFIPLYTLAGEPE